MNRKTRRINYRVKILKDMVFVLFTVALILCIAFFVDATVVSQADDKVTVDEEYYRVLEEEYVNNVRCFLTQQGFENSGVNLTMVADAEGNRNYSLQLHHKRIARLTAAQQEELLESVKTMAFQVVGCDFEVSILL